MFTGSQVSLSVTATWSGPLSYQWRKNGVDISGATSDVLTLDDVKLADAAKYDVLVYNSGYRLLSSPAIITVDGKVAGTLLVTNPSDSRNLLQGTPVSLSVLASENSAAWSFQWIKDGADIPGATQNTYYISSVQPWHAGAYTVRVKKTVSTSTAELVPDSAVLAIKALDTANWSGLQAYYKFDGDAKDSSGFQIDGTVKTGATFGADHFSSAAGSASLTVNNAGVTLPDSPLLAKARTISIWARPDATGAGLILFRGDQRTGSDPINLSMDAQGFPSFVTMPGMTSSGSVTLTSPVALARGAWNHVGLTIEETAGKTATTTPVTYFRLSGSTQKYNRIEMYQGVTLLKGHVYEVTAVMPKGFVWGQGYHCEFYVPHYSDSGIRNLSPFPTVGAASGEGLLDAGDHMEFRMLWGPTEDRSDVHLDFAFWKGANDVVEIGNIVMKDLTTGMILTPDLQSPTLTSEWGWDFVEKSNTRPATYSSSASNSTVALYVNGVKVAEKAGVPSTDTALNASFQPGWGVGTFPGTTQNLSYAKFPGKLDDLRIYARTLTAEELLKVYEDEAPSILPVITTQPLAGAVNVGADYVFTVAATGSGLSYQWFRDGTSVIGGNTPRLDLRAVTSDIAGTYTVKVTNKAGTVTSSPAVLSISAAKMFIDITSQTTGLAGTTGAAAWSSGSMRELANAGTASPYYLSLDNDQLRVFSQTAPFQFVDVTSKVMPAGVKLPAGNWLLGDFDNNGSQDLVYWGAAGIRVLLNTSGTFAELAVNTTVNAKLADFFKTLYSLQVADVDGDGDLDIVFSYRVADTAKPGRIACLYNDAVRGSDGRQTWTANTNAFNRTADLFSLGWGYPYLSVADLNLDGKPDLLVGERRTTSISDGYEQRSVHLFLNNGAGGYEEKGTPLSGMADYGFYSADYQGTGRLDLVQGSSDWPWAGSYPHAYWSNTSGGFDKSSQPEFERQSGDYHFVFNNADFDLDGRSDAFWSQLGRYFGGLAVGKFKIWKTTGSKTYQDVSADWGLNLTFPAGSKDYASTVADFDGDGSPDLLINAAPWEASTLRMFRNTASKLGANYLKIRLTGVASPRDGTGARIEVRTGDKVAVRFLSGNERSNLPFGLGSSKSADLVKVYWPSGAVSEAKNVPGNQWLEVVEPAAALFEVVRGRFTWSQATADAAKRGGRLAVLSTKELHTQGHALQVGANAVSLWIGATDEKVNGTWRWLDGSLMGFSNWSGSEPNDYFGPASENYLQMYANGTWNDLPDNPSWALEGYLLERTGAALRITKQPESVSANFAAAFSLSVQAEGSGAISYQWFKDNAEVPGATAATMSVAALTRSSVGTYWVVVSQGTNKLTSEKVTVTMANPPPVPTDSLLAWWPLDGNAVDMGPNAIHGKLTNVTAGADRFNRGTRALSFTGSRSVSNFVDFGTADKLRLAGDSSVVFWVKFADSDSLAPRILSFGANQFELSTTTGKGARQVQFTVGGLTVKGGRLLDVGQWHHIVAIRKAGRGYLYVNGRLDGEGAMGIAPSYGKSLNLARNSSVFDAAFSGSLDDMRFYGRALTSLEVEALGGQPDSGDILPPVIVQDPKSLVLDAGAAAQLVVKASGSRGVLYYQWTKDGIEIPGATSAALTIPAVQNIHIGAYACTVSDGYASVTSATATLSISGVSSGLWQGLIGHWKLDGNGKDSSGFANHATMVGTPASTADRFGVGTGAFSFFGNNSYFEIPDRSAFDLNKSDATLSAWIKTSSATPAWLLTKMDPTKAGGVGIGVGAAASLSSQSVKYFKLSHDANYSAYQRIRMVSGVNLVAGDVYEVTAVFPADFVWSWCVFEFTPYNPPAQCVTEAISPSSQVLGAKLVGDHVEFRYRFKTLNSGSDQHPQFAFYRGSRQLVEIGNIELRNITTGALLTPPLDSPTITTEWTWDSAETVKYRTATIGVAGTPALSASSVIWGNRGTAAKSAADTMSVGDNKWHLVTAVYDRKGKMSLYLDGTKRVERDLLPADIEASNDLSVLIGKATGTTSITGAIDDVRWYNKAMTEADVLALFRQNEIVDTDGDGLSDAYEYGWGRYEIVPGAFTWAEAKAHAEAKGGHLATITSEAEWQAIKTVVGPAVTTSNLWLGGTDEGSENRWRWITGEKWNFSKWGRTLGNGQEPNGGTSENYLNLFLAGYVDRSNGFVWNDWGSSGRCGYLFERGYFTDSTKWDTDGDGVSDSDEINRGTDPTNPDGALLASMYKFVPGSFSWTQAKADAEAKGGHLATITSAAEWSAAASQLGSDASKCMWLGGFQSTGSQEPAGGWKWVTAEPFVYTNWASGEPNNTFGAGLTEDYLVVNWERLPSGSWNDLPNSIAAFPTRGPVSGYLLEIEPAISNKYKFVSGSFTWMQAKADAEANGGHLATVTSQAEWDLMAKSLGSDFDREGWLGGRDPNKSGQWEWVTGESFVFNKWSTQSFRQPIDLGNPAPHYMRKWPVRTDGNSNQWDDVDSTATQSGYFLEIESAIPNKYSVVKGRFTWQEAKADAEKQGGHLVTVGSAAEWDTIRLALGNDFNTLDLWMGATDEVTEGQWQWVTGEPFAFQTWCSGEPNGSGNYMHKWVRGGNKWDDIPNNHSDPVGYILEIEQNSTLRELKITTQPTSVTVPAAGATASFSVSAQGLAPLTYQWKKDGVNISGATDPSLVLKGVTISLVGKYTVEVRDSLGQSVTSNQADLAINGVLVGVGTGIANGLMAHYPLMTDTRDLSPAGRHGVASGSLIFDPVDKSAVFNGTDAFVTVNDLPSIGDLPMTCSAWVKLAARSETGVYPNNILSNDIPAQYGQGFGLNLTSSGTILCVEYYKSFSRKTLTSVKEGVWAHVSVVYETGKFVTYLNGQELEQASVVMGAKTGNATMFIGKHNDDPGYGTRRFFKGALRDVRIYNRALAATEVLALYNAEKAVPPLITKQPVGLRMPPGSSGVLRVEASGTAPLSYQWYFGDQPVSGATSQEFALNSVTEAKQGTYKVLVSNGGGGVYSDSVLVDVLDPVSTVTLYVAKNGNDTTGTGAQTKPFLTIGKAISTAASGSRILVGAGTYAERLDFGGKSLRINSTSGPSSTIIQGSALNTVVYIDAAATNSELRGFKIIGGTGRPSPSSYGFDYYGGGVYCATSALIADCIFDANGKGTLKSNSATFGGAIYSTGGKVQVVNCLLVGNYAWACGGATLTENGSIEFDRCTVYGNDATTFFGRQGGLAVANGGRMLVRNCIVWGNGGSQLGAFGWPYNVRTEIVVEYSDIQSPNDGGGAQTFKNGVGNVSGDPLFADTVAKNFSLKTGSPALDSAAPGTSKEADGSAADMGWRADRFGGDNVTIGSQLFADVTDSVRLPEHELLAEMDGGLGLAADKLVRVKDGSLQLWRPIGAFGYRDVMVSAGLPKDLLGVGFGGYYAVGDVDNNGAQDLVVYDATGLRVFLNTGGVFKAAVVPAALTAKAVELFPKSSGDFVLADLDGDGDLDLAFNYESKDGDPGRIAQFTNDSTLDGASGRRVWGTGDGFNSIADVMSFAWQKPHFSVTDSNADGLPDLIVIETNGNWPMDTHASHKAHVYLNNLGGTGASTGFSITQSGAVSSVAFPHDAVMNTGKQATIEFWVRGSGVKDTDIAKVFRFLDGKENKELLVKGDGSVSATYAWAPWPGAVAPRGSVKMDGVWHHVAFSRHLSGVYEIYVDGASVASGQGGSSDAIIGTATPTQIQVSGGIEIDEVRWSSTDRYSSGFTPVRRFDSDSNSALLVHFDEGSGGTVQDSGVKRQAGALPAGWVWRTEAGKRSNGLARYGVIDGTYTYAQAVADAAARGGHLLTLGNGEEWSKVVAELTSRVTASNYWIGAVFADEVWGWVTGEAMDYTNWEGDGPGGDTAGAYVSAGTSTWRTAGEGVTQGYIIEWEPAFVEVFDAGLAAANELSAFLSVDVDGDGILDLVNGSGDLRPMRLSAMGVDGVCRDISSGGSTPKVFYGNGDGTYRQEESPFFTQSGGIGYGSLSRAPYHLLARVADLDLDGRLDGWWSGLRSDEGGLGPKIWRGMTSGLSEVSKEWGIDIGDTTGNRFLSGYLADWDGDGDLDLVVRATGSGSGAYKVYRSNAADRGGRWLKVRLVGFASPRDGTGARVSVLAGTKSETQYVGNLSSDGGQNATQLVFGLGTAESASQVIVTWPNGQIQYLTNVPAGQVVEILQSTVVPDWLRFSEQPLGRTVSVGNEVLFSSLAKGTGTITYQWFKDGVAIVGATSNTYKIAAAALTSVGDYHVVASTAKGRAVSQLARLEVAVPPSIVTQPVATSAIAGADAAFTVDAVGTALLTYQWYKGTVLITGATSRTLTLKGVSATDVASYSVKVTNPAGSVTSNSVALSLLVPVQITKQPSAATVSEGTALSLSVTATGTAALNYQWYRDGMLISGATAATYSVAKASAADAGSYVVTVTNAAGEVSSTPAAVVVNLLPRILNVAETLLVKEMSPFSLVADVTGAAPLIYTWKRGTTVLTTQTTATMAIESAALDDTGDYTLDVKNGVGTASLKIATVSVQALPRIVKQPVSVDSIEGASVVLGVSATGAMPLSYQWYKGDVEIAGQTSPTLSLSPLSSADHEGSYKVRVANSVGRLFSDTVTVSVKPALMITQQPQAVSLQRGMRGEFNVVATGAGPLLYQWFKDGAPLPDETQDSLLIASISNYAIGDYTVLVTDIFGNTVRSDVASLSVDNVSPTFWKGLMAHWKLAGDSRDASPFLNHGKGINVQPTTDRFGIENSAMRFSGKLNKASRALSSQHISVPHAQSLQPSDKYSIALWAKPEFAGENLAEVTPFMLGKRSGTDLRDSSYSLTSGFAAGDRDKVNGGGAQTGYVQGGTASLVDGQWQMFVLVSDGTKLFVYRNGVQAGVQSVTSSALNPNSGPLRIGSGSGDGYQEWFGCLDEIRIYNKALSAAEVQDLYTLDNVRPEGAVAPPAIVVQPVGVKVTEGMEAVLQVEATGGVPLSYQWKRNGEDVEGATSASLRIASVTTAKAGSYSVEVSNVVGSVVSVPVYLDVLPAPVVETVYVAKTGSDTTGSGSQTAPFLTITKGISAAKSGFRVSVGPGTYAERVEFAGKTLILESSSGEAATRIEAPSGNSAVFIDAKAVNSQLRGFTIAGGTGRPMTTNTSTITFYGGGVCVMTSALVENCVIDGNGNATGIRFKSQASYGGGVYTNGGSVLLVNCLIIGNHASEAGGGVFTERGSCELDRCTVYGNTVGTYNAQIGGLAVRDSGKLLVRSSIVRGNSGQQIGAMPFPYNKGTSLYVEYSDIEGGATQGQILAFTTGAGNISGDPLFENAAAKNFALRAGSPALDAAAPGAPKEADGSLADMGYRADRAGSKTGQAQDRLLTDVTTSAAGRLPVHSLVALVDSGATAKVDRLVRVPGAAGSVVRLWRSSGEFSADDVTAAVGLPLDLGTGLITVGDFDNNGAQDIACWNASGLRVYLNTAGVFKGQTVLAAVLDKSKALWGQTAGGFEVVDINGDGLLDLVFNYTVTGTAAPGRIGAFLASGTADATGRSAWGTTGGFTEFRELLSLVWSKPHFSLADVNGDGLADLVVLETEGRSPVDTGTRRPAHVYLNKWKTNSTLAASARYEFVSGDFTWAAAKADAESKGGHLLVATNEAEWELVKALNGFSGTTKGWWLGASDASVEGQWRWTTGEAWSFSPVNSGAFAAWMPAADNTQNYLSAAANGDWSAAAGATLKGYILEREPGADLVMNGGFEDLGFERGNAGFYNGTTAPSWTVKSGNVDFVQWKPAARYWPSSAGEVSVDLAGNTGVVQLQQTLKTKIGATYVLEFDYSKNSDRPSSPSVLKVEGIGKTLLVNESVTPSSNVTRQAMNWRRFSKKFVADSESTIIAFTNVSSILNNPCGATLDEVHVYQDAAPLFTEVFNSGVTGGNELSKFQSADINGDGKLDLVIGSSSEGTADAQAPLWFEGNGTGTFIQRDVAFTAGVSVGHRRFAEADVNLDGFLDPVWLGGDAAKNLQVRLWRGKGGAEFQEATAEWGVDAGMGAGRLHMDGYFSDWDGDGDLDLVVRGWDDSSTQSFYKIYRNQAFNRGAKYARVRLEGVRSPRDGQGARIELTAGGRTQVQYVGNLGESHAVVKTFGLGAATSIEKLVVKWPSGVTQELKALPINQILEIKETVVPVDSVQILAGPQSVTAVAAQLVTLSCEATGTGTLVYQWYKDGVAILGATSSKYDITSLSAAMAGAYTVRVSVGTATVLSSVAMVEMVSAPVVVTAPQSVLLLAGQTARLTVAVSGTEPLSYQWMKGGLLIIGATNPSLNVPDVSPASVDSYTVKITNAYGSVTSAAARIDLATPPAIAVQPQDKVVVAGATASLSVSATGTAPLTYQWYKDGVSVPTGTSATYSLVPVTASTAGVYTVTVTNAFGSVDSMRASVEIASLPVILEQPAGVSCLAGQPFQLTVRTALGVAQTYQWYKAGVLIAGATSSTYSVSASQVSDASTYYVKVTNVAGTVQSSTVSVTVSTPPSITVQPLAQQVKEATAVTLSVVAQGSATLTYQWMKNGVNIAGATAASYLIKSASISDAGVYAVKVSNSVGSIQSSDAELGLLLLPKITKQPLGLTVVVGDVASFTVEASGSGVLAYQWRKAGAPISGATGPIYSIPSVQPTDAGNYDVVVTSSLGTVTSSAVALSVNLPVSITTHPVSRAANVATSTTFTVAATGTAPITYQWRKNGSNVLGATSASFTIPSLIAADAGDYDVVVTNPVGSVNSSVAKLVVNGPVVITSQPVGVTVNPGSPVNLQVAATGAIPITYQWRKNGVAIAGATSDAYSIASAQISDGAQYSVVVSNIVGSVTSSTATVVVNTPVSITTQPAGITVNPGVSVSLKVVASGSAPITYQWRVGGVNIPGATGPTYTIPAAAASDAGSYDVIVSNMVNSVTSSAALLGLNTPLTITSHPVAATVNPSASVSFSVAVTGSSPITYQWRKGGVAIAGATAATYTIPAAQAANAGLYDVVVTNPVGSVTSNQAALAVNIPVSITTQPLAKTVNPGSAIALSVVAAGTSPLTYQWRKDGVNIDGATQATFNIASANLSDVGSYSVVVSNVVGSVTSNAAAVDVNRPLSITTQPQSVAVNPGGTASFAVVANGSAPITYQWRKGGVAITGATASTYAVSAAQAANEGSYDVIVTNAVGSVTSSAATLSVNTPVVITAQPVGGTVVAGISYSMSVTATGTAPMSYQWYKGGAAIPGATASTYSVASISASDVGTYTVKVSNMVNSVTSSSAAIAVSGPPVVSTDPVAMKLICGTPGILSAQVYCMSSFTYKWRKDGADLLVNSKYGAVSGTVLGANTPSVVSLSFLNPDDLSEGSYSLYVSNADGNAESKTAAVTVEFAAPKFLEVKFLNSGRTVDLRAYTGGITFNNEVPSNETIKVNVKASSAITYQWSYATLKPGYSAVLTGQTADALDFTAAGVNKGIGIYTCTATAGGKVTAMKFNISTFAPAIAATSLEILTQPQSVNVVSGGSVLLTAGVSTGIWNYTWFKQGVNGGPDSVVGVSGSFLSLNSVQAAEAGTYFLVVTDEHGNSVVSDTVTVSVFVSAD